MATSSVSSGTAVSPWAGVLAEASVLPSPVLGTDEEGVSERGANFTFLSVCSEIRVSSLTNDWPHQALKAVSHYLG